VTFRRDFSGPRLAAWNTLLQCLESIQLGTGPDEFRWNLHHNWMFLVSSLYNAIIQSDIILDDNKKIWKMKIPLKTKIFGWYLCRGVILTKDDLVKRNWCVFCHHDETIKHLFFPCHFARFIWSIILVASKLYPPTIVANIFDTWLHGIDIRFRTFIRVGELAIIWSLWLCINDKVFNDKNCSLLQVIYRRYSPLVVTSATGGKSRSLYRGLYMSGGYGKGYFSLYGWQHNLRIDPPPTP
jgi:hypothetical protein